MTHLIDGIEHSLDPPKTILIEIEPSLEPPKTIHEPKPMIDQ